MMDKLYFIITTNNKVYFAKFKHITNGFVTIETSRQEQIEFPTSELKEVH